jgi:hypothetical protein
MAVATVSATPKPKPNRLKKLKKGKPKERLERSKNFSNNSRNSICSIMKNRYCINANTIITQVV